MRNPYEYDPEDEPCVCATCARFFEFDQVCNVPETVVKAMKEQDRELFNNIAPLTVETKR